MSKMASLGAFPFVPQRASLLKKSRPGKSEEEQEKIEHFQSNLEVVRKGLDKQSKKIAEDFIKSHPRLVERSNEELDRASFYWMKEEMFMEDDDMALEEWNKLLAGIRFAIRNKNGILGLPQTHSFTQLLFQVLALMTKKHTLVIWQRSDELKRAAEKLKASASIIIHVEGQKEFKKQALSSIQDLARLGIHATSGATIYATAESLYKNPGRISDVLTALKELDQVGMIGSIIIPDAQLAPMDRYKENGVLRVKDVVDYLQNAALLLSAPFLTEVVATEVFQRLRPQLVEKPAILVIRPNFSNIYFDLKYKHSPDQVKEQILAEIGAHDGERILIHCHTIEARKEVFKHLDARGVEGMAQYDGGADKSYANVLQEWWDPDGDLNILICSNVTGNELDISNTRCVIEANITKNGIHALVQHLLSLGKDGNPAKFIAFYRYEQYQEFSKHHQPDMSALQSVAKLLQLRYDCFRKSLLECLLVKNINLIPNTATCCSSCFSGISNATEDLIDIIRSIVLVIEAGQSLVPPVPIRTDQLIMYLFGSDNSGLPPSIINFRHQGDLQYAQYEPRGRSNIEDWVHFLIVLGILQLQEVLPQLQQAQPVPPVQPLPRIAGLAPNPPARPARPVPPVQPPVQQAQQGQPAPPVHVYVVKGIECDRVLQEGYCIYNLRPVPSTFGKSKVHRPLPKSTVLPGGKSWKKCEALNLSGPSPLQK